MNEPGLEDEIDNFVAWMEGREMRQFCSACGGARDVNRGAKDADGGARDAGEMFHTTGCARRRWVSTIT